MGNVFFRLLTARTSVVGRLADAVGVLAKDQRGQGRLHATDGCFLTLLPATAKKASEGVQLPAVSGSPNEGVPGW